MEEVIKSIIPSMVEEGSFGNVKFVSLESDVGTDIGAQFASALAFLNLTVHTSSGKEVFPLVVKLPFDDEETREARNSDAMFHNEVTMYKEILPALGFEENGYPNIYCGVATPGAGRDKNLLILDNLKYKGFMLSKERVFLDFDHISLIVKKIAEFHSLSYIMKHNNREKFFQLVEKLKDVVLSQSLNEEFFEITAASLQRGVKPLIKNNLEVDILEKFLSLLSCPYKSRQFLSIPEEPFAVICHGDFCNNNILYKYDQSGSPIDYAFFDFQLSKYSSPAIDLFFFLYMHTTSDFRKQYWDDIIKLYWNSLKNSLPSHIEIPNFKEYLNHFAKRAVYGYTICSWFLPFLTAEHIVSVEEYNKLSLEEKREHFTTMGGKTAEKLISEVALHMLKNGYINKYLEYCKEKEFRG